LKTTTPAILTPTYRFGIFAICAAYLIFQLACIPSIWLEVDELWFAHHIYQFTLHTPYQDFPPYKTVLGYYLLSIPLYFTHGVLTPIYYIKDEIALINTLFIGGLAWWAVRMFQPRAVFYTLVLILANQLFLFFSAELRVDMLTSWLCLVSILFLVNTRNDWAGIFIGLAFLTSQKALWYILGTNLALGLYWLAYPNPAKNFRAILTFNLTMLAVIAVYLAFWAALSSWHEVLRSVFYEGYTQSKIDFYAYSTSLYWRYILRHGCLLMLLLPLTLLSLFQQQLSRQRFLLMTYGLLSLGIVCSYKQFFPYNTVFLFPAFFVVFAEFFSWLLTPGYENVKISQRGLFWFFSLYLIALVALIFHLQLAYAYYSVVLLPILLWYSLSKKVPLSGASLTVIGLVVLLIGVLLPLADFGTSLHVREARYQQANILMANNLLENGSYIAGTFIFHDRDQSIAGFENLIQPAQEYAETANAELMYILIPSLNITPKTATEMLTDLKNAKLKLLVNNVRIAALPVQVLNYLRQEYEHYWGALYLYAPTVAVGEQQFLLKFSGNYTVEAAENIVLDQQTLTPQNTIKLTAGQHVSVATRSYRLRLLPDHTQAPLNLAYQHDCPYCFFKEPSF
jgi:hypothetical protein